MPARVTAKNVGGVFLRHSVDHDQQTAVAGIDEGAEKVWYLHYVRMEHEHCDQSSCD